MPDTDGTGGAFALSVLEFGNVVVGVQPARGYNIDPTDSYHSPDLVPPHNYLAFYIWLRRSFGAQAVVHMGKHGNLEWLPGKALALSRDCWPEAVLGPMPHLYPFIVNDPGEGTQAKRRAQAVIIDHLTPPLTRAETYGPLRDLEALVDEYYEAAGVDPRRIDHLRREILSLSAATGLDKDVGFGGEDEATDLAKLDAYLCELKEAQIRDGLHVFGLSPGGGRNATLPSPSCGCRADRERDAMRRSSGRWPTTWAWALIRSIATWPRPGRDRDPMRCTGLHPARGGARATPWSGSRHWRSI